MRVIPALCFVALVVRVTVFSFRVYGTLAALLAAVLVCGSGDLVFTHFARHGAMDCPLTLALTCALLPFAEERRPNVTVPALACAAAALVKGVAALQVAPVMIAWAALRRDGVVVRRMLTVASAAAVPFAIWLAMSEHVTPGFIDNMISVDILGRTVDVIGAPEPQHLLYWRHVGATFLPAMAVIAFAAAFGAKRQLTCMASLVKGPRAITATMLGVWGFVPVFLFSLARTQHAWYAFPSYVPIAILFGPLLAISCRRLAVSLSSRGCGWATTRTIGAAVVVLLLLPNLVHLLRLPGAALKNTSMVRDIEREAKRCSDGVEVYRAYHAPALLFYLTRSGIKYRWIDDDSLATNDKPSGCRVIFAPRSASNSLADALPEWRMVGERSRYVGFFLRD